MCILFFFRFRVLHTPICISHDGIQAVVMAACVLHNLIASRTRMERTDVDHEDPETYEVIHGSWRLQGQLQSVTSRRYTATELGKEVRNRIKTYVNSPEGSVSWQESMI